jgi:hypothetical protein
MLGLQKHIGLQPSLGLDAVLGGAAGGVIGGWAIGQAGQAGTLYQTYTLAGGDDFNSLDLVGPWTPTAKWFPTGAYHAATIRNNSTSLGYSWDADPLTTGYLDSNRGVSVGLSSIFKPSPSVVRLLTRKATAAEQAHFGPTDSAINGGIRPMISSMLHSAGCFAYFNTTVPVLVSVRAKFSPKLTNPGGSHISLWDTCVVATDTAVCDERDIECTSQGLYHETISHGATGTGTGSTAGASTTLTLTATPAIAPTIGGLIFGTGIPANATVVAYNGTTGITLSTAATVSSAAITWGVRTLSNGSYDLMDDQFHIFDYVFVNGSATKLYVDGVLRSSLASDSQKSGKANHFIMSNHIINGFNGDNYDNAAWLASNIGAYVDIDWVRFAYDTAAGRSWKPLVALADVNVAFAGTASIVLPDALTLFGDATATYDVQVMPYDSMEPGLTTSTAFTRLPPGWTYDAPSRTISIDYSATGGNAGRSHVVVYGFKTDTGFVAQPARFVVNRGPSFPLTSVEPIPDGAGGLTADLYYTADVGYIFPKSFSATGLPAGWSLNPTTGILSAANTSVTGGTISVTVTNGAGQQATANLELWSPAVINSLFTWDTTNATAMPNDGSSKVQYLYDIYDNTKRLAQTTSANRPLLSTTGGGDGTRRVMSTVSNGPAIRSDDAAATNVTALVAAANTANATTGTLYAVFAAKESAISTVNRILAWAKNDGTQSITARYTTTGRGATILAAGGAQQSADQATQDTSMHVYELIKNGNSLTFTVDGAAGGTVTVTQTGAITADMFILFGTQAGGAMVGQIGPGFFSNTIPNTADKLRARQWVGSRMGVTVS